MTIQPISWRWRRLSASWADAWCARSQGRTRLRLLLNRDFALIMLDVNMPSLGGFETARLIRERKRSRHTPIIFVTAYGRDEQDILAAYKLGAVDFLFKPIVAEIVQAKAGVFVDLQRRTEEVARQAEQLREHERREHERALVEQRMRWDEEILRRERDGLAEADRHKDEFIAMLGHELRNPLASIVTGLEVLGRRLSKESSLDAAVRGPMRGSTVRWPTSRVSSTISSTSPGSTRTRSS